MPTFTETLQDLFRRGNREADLPITVTIPPPQGSGLDALSVADKTLLVRYFFHHLVPIDENRIARIQTWTGVEAPAPASPASPAPAPAPPAAPSAAPSVPSASPAASSKSPKSAPTSASLSTAASATPALGAPPGSMAPSTPVTLPPPLDSAAAANAHSANAHSANAHSANAHSAAASGTVATPAPAAAGSMAATLLTSTNKTPAITTKLLRLKTLLIGNIDFRGLLANKETRHLLKLCNLVGHWGFPAHELSNDDLVYCVFLILKYCMLQLPEAAEALKLSDNEIFGLVFMTRDTYHSGNPFHNFRHAVDVLQACFHYLIRLGYLPLFTQFQSDPQANELHTLHLEKFGNAVELIPLHNQRSSEFTSIECLALLVAALGHDVGHPGVTNQFMIKYALPIALVFNERLVLESFHTSVFLNKILVINWPQLLDYQVEKDLSVKQLIITSILATDMAEHFLYIDKLKNLQLNQPSRIDRIKLILSLLIKCADISNVTRPLRILAQWALVLSREFDEIAKVERRLQDPTLCFDVAYTPVPESLERVLALGATLPQGQIFFINTFAENLFNSICELLPQLRFTREIVGQNKAFWAARMDGKAG